MHITTLISGIAVAMALAAPAAAQSYRFDVTDPDATLGGQPMGTYTFYLDASPTPDSSDDISFTVNGLTHSNTFSGNTTFDSFTFYTADAGGGFGDDENQYEGPVLFTGTLDHPTFKTGTFAIDDFIVDGSITITDLSTPPSVPEPASWALMLGGFGLAGGALRRRSRIAFA